MKKLILGIGCLCAATLVMGQLPALEWAKQIGSALDDEGLSIATDAQGNIYTTGAFGGTTDFDPGAGTFNLTSNGNLDIFVSKTDAAGNFVWAKNMGGSGDDVGNAIKVDAAGNVYVTGWFKGTGDFDPGTGIFNLMSAGDDDAFILKLDAQGNLTWAKSTGNATLDQGGDISIDAAGNVYTLGTFSGIIDLDPGAAVASYTSNGSYDNFLLKLDATGNFVWAKQWGTSGLDYSYSINVDAAGMLYITFSFVGTIDTDPGAGTNNITSAGSLDFAIIKLNATGNFISAVHIGSAQDAEAFAMKLDASGNMYLTGYFEGTVDFDPGPGTANLSSSAYYDMFVLKLDASSNFVWAKKIGGSGYEYGMAIAVDNTGNIYTTGFFNGTADFDPGTGTINLSSAGSNQSLDIFVSKLDASGNAVWASRHGGLADDAGRGIATDASGNVYTCGHFEGGAIDFDPGTGVFNLSSSAGAPDIFIQKVKTVPATTVGIQEANNIDDFGIYPVPAHDLLTITLSTQDIDLNLEIYDCFGALVYMENDLRTSRTVKISHLPEGIYIARLTSSDKIFATQKIIKE